MLWKDNTLIVEPPAKPKKMTGTRFASVLGLNRWCTPFETWCAITRTYEKPFEDTIYTIAGKTIEPKQADYCENYLFMDITRPTDIYGPDPFKKTFGDFFPDDPIFGGMWDYLELDNTGQPYGVLEMKTTKRSEDWINDIPEYYALQAALYAYLLGFDKVTMVCSFLQESDYKAPDKFVPTMENTICRTFYISERYPDFVNDYVTPALKWWNNHVHTGISPEYDEKADKEILDALRTNNPETDDIEQTLKEASELKRQIAVKEAELKPMTERLKLYTDAIKKYAIEQFRDGDTDVRLGDWNTKKSIRETPDKTKMKKDGVYETYMKPSITYTITYKGAKETKA